MSIRIKTLGIFFAPILIPRAIALFRSLRASFAHRPTPRPLPSLAARAVNILFFSTALFFILSLPINPHAPSPNIFALTSSHLSTPTDILFSRLARQRPQNTLTVEDAALRAKFGSPAARKLYLRFGPDTLISCPFCSLDSQESYLLYHVPLNALLPHLFHLLIIVLVTSAPLVGEQAGRWRIKFTFAAVALALVEIVVVSRHDATAHRTADIPTSLYNQIYLLRQLIFSVFDAFCALLIYLSATRRYFFTPPSPADKAEELVSIAGSTLAVATSKLHALSVVRSATVRDKVLKARDDAYWRTAVAMECSGEDARINIWEEEEVVKAISRAMRGRRQEGGVDIAKLRADASVYVDGVTQGLELSDDNPDI